MDTTLSTFHPGDRVRLSPAFAQFAAFMEIPVGAVGTVEGIYAGQDAMVAIVLDDFPSQGTLGVIPKMLEHIAVEPEPECSTDETKDVIADIEANLLDHLSFHIREQFEVIDLGIQGVPSDSLTHAALRGYRDALEDFTAMLEHVR
jgi:hypothetical protein